MESKNVKKKKLVKRNGSRRLQLKYKECFFCREMGHLMTSCPKQTIIKDEKTDDGILHIHKCYRCGSSEHNSRRCKAKETSFKYAICFVCGERGHVSRECAKNPNGIYPRGGSCMICQKTDHLAKFCPLKKNKNPTNDTEYKPKVASIMDNPDAEDFNEDMHPIPVKKARILKIR